MQTQKNPRFFVGSVCWFFCQRFCVVPGSWRGSSAGTAAVYLYLLPCAVYRVLYCRLRYVRHHSFHNGTPGSLGNERCSTVGTPGARLGCAAEILVQHPASVVAKCAPHVNTTPGPGRCCWDEARFWRGAAAVSDGGAGS